MQTLRDRQEPSLSIIDSLRSNRPVDQLGPGDVLSVSIYEAGSGLFNTRKTDTGTGAGTGDAAPSSASTSETLPRLQVDRNGMIMAPYAGEIHVAGRPRRACSA